MIKRRRGFIAELITGITKALSIVAYAEEPVAGQQNPDGVKDPEPQPAEPKSPTINYEDLIAKARREEREKQYKKIEKLENEKSTLVEKNNTALLRIGELETQLEEAKKTYNSDEANKKVKDLTDELNKVKAELEELQKNTVDEEVIRKDEREKVTAELEAQNKVTLYRLEKLAELKDSVIPELVTGTTIEEIDASIETSKTRFKEIQSQILGQKSVPSAVPNQSSTNLFQGKDAMTMEEFAQLDPTSPEYAKFRASFGLR